MKLFPPILMERTCIRFEETVLNQCVNGLFRATFSEARTYLPELTALYDSAEKMLRACQYDPNEFEIDIKIHMLMPNQYPCIPNWHCDNVPRDENGITDYQRAEAQSIVGKEHPMFLWISSTPCTEFLTRELIYPGYPTSHSDVADFINNLVERQCSYEVMPLTTFVEPNVWYAMDRRTPHRGTLSQKNQWRVFCRLTHKSMMKERVQTSVVRRHSQVYLDSAKFSW